MKFPLAHVASMIVVVSLALSCACSGGAAQSESPAAGDAADVVPGEVIVQFQPGTSAARIDAVLAAAGTRVAKELGMPLVFLVRFSGATPVAEMVQRLRSYPEVQHAEPNRVVRIGPPRMPPAKPGARGN